MIPIEDKLNSQIADQSYSGYGKPSEAPPTSSEEKIPLQPSGPSTPSSSSEIQAAMHEMREEHVILPVSSSALQASPSERKAELEQKYDELGLTHISKDEWVAMRLNLEQKLRGGLLHRLKRAAATLGKGLSAIQERNLTGVTLRAPYHLEAILPTHPMGDKLEVLFNQWKAAEESIPFDEWLNAHAPEVMEGPGVSYFTDSDRRSTRLTANREGLLMKDGIPYDTTAERVCSGSDKETKEVKYTEGTAMYVVGPDGRFNASSQVIYERHHSSLYAGGAIIGAGECKVENGRLTMLSNKSGHYKPTQENMLDVLKVLRAQGVSLSDVKLMIIQSDKRKFYYSSAERFLESNGRCIPSRVTVGRSVTKFKEEINPDGSVKRSIYVRGGLVADALKICREGGWTASEVQLRVVGSERKHQFIYNNAERYENGWCPDLVRYGDNQSLRVISDSENPVRATRLIFDEGTTSQQMKEIITSLRNFWLNVNDAQYQIGDSGAVSTVAQFLEDEQSRALRELLQSHGAQSSDQDNQSSGIDKPLEMDWVIEEHEEGYPEVSGDY